MKDWLPETLFVVLVLMVAFVGAFHAFLSQ